MSINRSELKKIEKETSKKFFYSESEAFKYKNSLGNIVAKIDQWQIILDDANDDELAERSKEIEQLIESRKQEQIAQFGKVLMNESQENLLRKVYKTSVDAWSVSIVSEKTPEEFYSKGYEVPMIDDEVDGWIPADSVKLIDDTRDQI